jgi:glycosidase
MADFVFGGIEADEGRLLATERSARSGIRHFHQIEPLDPQPDQPVTLTVQAGPDVLIDHITAYVTVDGSNPAGERGQAINGFAVDLQPAGIRWENLIWDYVTLWSGEIPAQPQGTLVQYRIEGWRAGAEEAAFWSREMNLDRTVERPALYGYWVDTQGTPDWAHEAIIYHVFVDRFYGMPEDMAGRWLAPAEMNGFIGGTLAGVIEKLDFIRSTGANTLWLSPVFVTPTYHGYDTTDYSHVDPRFGTDDSLVDLFAQAHRKGLRVILDFVANHTSVEFAPFVEARNDPESPYRRWFSFDESYQHGYRAFFDVATMPQLNTEEPAVRDYLNRAAQHWLRAGADGLRLEYAAGPNHLFWSSFRAACRAARPDCWLFGEVTRAGSVLRAYTGRLDGCLDFAFCRAVRMLCSQEPPQMELGQFINQVANARQFFGADFVLPAFIDNHDMNRFLWVAGGDKRRLRLALGLLFALGGPPVLYYGTEVGLGQPRAKGPHREESRHPMLWGEAQDRELLAYVQSWAAARRAHPALGKGSLHTLALQEAGAWLGQLVHGPDKVLLAVNAGTQPATLPLAKGSYTTVAGELIDCNGSLELPPLTVIGLVSVHNE